MGAARQIAVKDLRLRIRDRSALVIGVIAPLGLAFIFNLILGGVVEGEFVPKFTVLNQDQGGEVAAGLEQVLAMIDSEGFIELADPAKDMATAEQLVEGGSVAAAVVVPPGFSASVEEGASPSLQIIGNPDNPVSVEVARSIAEGYGAEVRTAQLAVATAGSVAGALSTDEIRNLAAAAVETPHPITVGRAEADRRELDLATFFAAAMAVFFLFFTVSAGVNGLLEERNQGTMARLLAAPIRASSIIAGKALVSFVLGLVSMTILIVASSLLLGADWGNPVGVALLVVAGVFAATGLMTVVAAFARTPEQAGSLQAILAVGLGMLGGIFFPASLGTGFLAKLALISPHRWFLTGLSDLAGGGSVAVVIPSLVGLGVFGVLSWALAGMRFRKGLSL